MELIESCCFHPVAEMFLKRMQPKRPTIRQTSKCHLTLDALVQVSPIPTFLHSWAIAIGLAAWSSQWQQQFLIQGCAL